MARKNLDDFAAKYGTNAQEVREMFKDAEEFILADPANAVQIKNLGIFKHVSQKERWFWNDKLKLYKAEQRAQVRLNPVRRRATKIGEVTSLEMNIQIAGFRDGFFGCRVTIKDGSIISNTLIDVNGEDFDREPQFADTPTLRTVPISALHITDLPGSGAPPVSERRTSILHRTRTGWAIENKQGYGWENFDVIDHVADNLFPERQPGVAYVPPDPDEWPIDPWRHAYHHVVFRTCTAP